MGYYIGIDIGTSSAKLLLIDSQGNSIKSCSRSYEIIENTPGWKEIEPETWLYAVEDALSELLSNVDTTQVMSIGVTGQMHTIVFLDEKGNSIRPAMMWNDTRTANMLPKLKENIRNKKEVDDIANIISTGSPAVNLLWLKQYEPEHFSKIHKFLIAPDYIVYRLTGKYQTDYCEASTSSLYDLKQQKWSNEIRKLLDFPECIYPEVKGTTEIVGTILPEYQKKYHLNNDVKVIVGTGDNPAAAIATGCIARNDIVLSLGTSGVLMFSKKTVSFDAKGKNILFSMNGKEISVLVQGVVQSCGNSLSWWLEKIQQTTDYDGEIGKIDIDHIGENTLIFYPHITGEKTIYANPDLRGCFIGIGTDVTRQDMTLAVMEGICFGIKQLTEKMNIPAEKLEDICVIGGGAKNEVWMQILADILNTSIVQTESNAGAVYGIALAAISAVEKDFSIEKILEQTLTIKKKFFPREYHVKLYWKKYQKYCNIYEALQVIEKN